MASKPFVVPRFGNVLCPPWMGFSRVLPGIRDTETDVDLPPVLVPAHSIVSNTLSNQLAIDADTDFLAREVQFVVLREDGTVNPDALRVRIRDGAGVLITTAFCPILDLNGPIVPPLPLCAGSVLFIDFQNTGGVDATVWMLFKGWKRSTCADQSTVDPRYIPMWRRYTWPGWPAVRDVQDFEYPFTFKSVGVSELLRIPLQTDNDADFLWRGITGDWNTANNDVAVVGNVALTFYDQTAVPLGQRGLLNPWSSMNAGEPREMILASGGGRPAPMWPEIFIPRGGVVYIDVSFGAAETVRFSLRGLKLYGGCA